MAALGGGDLGFVPTMGAFHQGHLHLMSEARKRHSSLCISIFVNPLQFGQGEDYEKYPRDEERDFALAEQHGVDYIFAPPASEIYPRVSTLVHVPEITELWEGLSRPGHFDGVATIVAKLFLITDPAVAYFGWKDLQQCLVIRRMVEDLNFRTQLEFLDTVREEDGLAMSSRNAYLSGEERLVARKLHTTLTDLSNSASASLATIEEEIRQAKIRLQESGFTVDYLELVSLEDLRPLRNPGPAAFIVAAKLGRTRLIDNVRLFLSQA
jgi:pantoate--beta-alanine ligase